MITSGRQTAGVVAARLRFRSSGFGHGSGTLPERKDPTFRSKESIAVRRGEVGGDVSELIQGGLEVFAGNGEQLEFVEGLAAQSAAVHQEEDAAGAGVSDER